MNVVQITETVAPGKRARTRAALIRRAWEIVRSEGAEALTMRRLAAEAKVSVGNAYGHFADREDLIEELRILAWDELERSVKAELTYDPLFDPIDSFEGAIRETFAAVMHFAQREPHLQSLIYLLPGTRFSERVMGRDLAAATKYIALFYRGEKAGEFVFATDPALYALSLWTAFQGQLQRLSANMPDTYRKFQVQVTDEILETFFCRIRAGKAKRHKKN